MLNGAGFIVRPGPAPLARRRRDRRRDAADRRPGRRRRAGLVAGRHADRVRLEPPPRPRPRATARPSTSSTSRRGDVTADHRRPGRRSSARRRGCPTAGRSPRSAAATGGPRGIRNDIWLFAADGSDATPDGGRNLSARHDLMPGVGDEQRRHPGEGAAARRRPPDGRSITVHGARSTARTSCGGSASPTATARAADRRPPLHLGLGRGRRAARSAADRLPPLDADRAARRVAARRGRRSRAASTAFNADVLGELELVEPVERHVDGRRPRHPGLVPPGRRGPQAARHRDPRRPAHALRLVADLGVPGPRRERDGRLLLATRAARRATARPSTTPTTATGAPARCATCSPASTRSSPTASPTRIASGVTGGSYGGYLTNWIVGHDQRFRAAMTCRSVSDMAMLFLTGDISGGDWARARVRWHALGRPGATTARSRR